MSSVRSGSMKARGGTPGDGRPCAMRHGAVPAAARLLPMPQHCDVLIVGAGPAGAMTALQAARHRPGLGILLTDAMPVPRPKPCGEFLSPDGLRILAQVGLEEAVMAS